MLVEMGLILVNLLGFDKTNKYHINILESAECNFYVINIFIWAYFVLKLR